MTALEIKLYVALYEVTETYWGVEDDKNGDGKGPPPGVIQRARLALSAARGAAEKAGL